MKKIIIPGCRGKNKKKGKEKRKTKSRKQGTNGSKEENIPVQVSAIKQQHVQKDINAKCQINHRYVVRMSQMVRVHIFIRTTYAKNSIGEPLLPVRTIFTHACVRCSRIWRI